MSAPEKVYFLNEEAFQLRANVLWERSRSSVSTQVAGKISLAQVLRIEIVTSIRKARCFSFILSTPAFDGGRTEVPRTPVNRTDTPLSVRCFDGEIIANLGLRLLRVRLRSGHTRDEPGRDATAFPWQGRAKCWQARLYSYPFTQPENRPCRSSSGPGARRQARAWPRPAEP